MQLKTKRLETQKKTNSSSSSDVVQKTLIPQINNNNNNTCCRSFTIGSQVEVSSDEEGFRGVWFLATVLKPPPAKYSFSHSHSHSLSSSSYNHNSNNNSKVFVEYKNLLAEENGSALLREFVDSKFVRPVPPVDIDVVNFKVNDVVDAYYQDGWWSGVVTEVVETDSKYKVFFSYPPDEILFGSSDLRVHRTWVDGSWVLPTKQRLGDMNFTPGTAVEVNIDLDNSRDVWFPAIVVKQVSDNNFLVELRSTIEGGLQKVGVDSLHIRPSPPSSSNNTFSLLEKVDALCDCRWLSGIVTKILADGRYIVYFKSTKKEKELCHKDLRLHMEWTNGKWVYTSRDTLMIPKSEKRSGYPNGGSKDKNRGPSEDTVVIKENNGQVRISAAPRRCEKDVHTPASEMADCISITSSNKRNRQTNSNGNAISLRPSRRSNQEGASDTTLSFETCKPKAKQTEVLHSWTSVDLNSSAPDYEETSLKQSDDSIQTSDSTEKGDDEKHPVMRKRGRPSKPRASVGEIVNETPTRSEVVKPFAPFGPIVIGLTHDGKSMKSRTENSGPLPESEKKAVSDVGKQVAASAGLESVESESQKEGEVTNLKRKRGRPPKVLLMTAEAVVPENMESVDNERQDAINVEGSPERISPAVEVEKSVAVVEPRNEAVAVVEPRNEADTVVDPRNEVVAIVEPRNEAVAIVEPHIKPVAVVEPLPVSNLRPTGDPLVTRASLISDHFKRAGLSLGKRSTSKRQVRKHRKIPIAAVMEPANAFILRGKKLKSINQAGVEGVSTEDVVTNCRGRTVADPVNGTGCEVGTVVAITSSNASDDDRPLSTWLEGAHCPTATDAIKQKGQFVETGVVRDQNDTPSGQPKEKVLDERQEASAGKGSRDSDATERQDETPIQCNPIMLRENPELPLVKNSFIWRDEVSAGHASRDNGATKRQDEMGMHASAVVPRVNEELPFVKNSPIWQMIESMEVLKRIPQDPHFRPLYNCKEECREGLAIGSMVTFTSLAERISRASLDDQKSQLDGYLEALVDLEELGFNVVPVRDLLYKLLSIKSTCEQDQNTAKEIESQIMEQKHEESKIDDAISVLEKKIAELKEKQALEVSKKERKSAEITSLQSRMDTIKGVLGSAQEEFKNITASLR